MKLASDTDVVIRRVRDVNGWMGNMSSYPPARGDEKPVW